MPNPLPCQVHSISRSSYLGGNCPVAVLVKELEGLFELGHLLLRQVLHGCYYPSSSSLSSYGFRVGGPFQSGECISGCFPFPTLERPEQRPRHGFRDGKALPATKETKCEKVSRTCYRSARVRCCCSDVGDQLKVSTIQRSGLQY